MRVIFFLYVVNLYIFLLLNCVFAFAHLSVESVIFKTLSCLSYHYSFPYLLIKTFVRVFFVNGDSTINRMLTIQILGERQIEKKT